MKASLTQLPPDRWNPASLGREVNLTLHSLQPHPTPRLRWGQHGAPAHERDADAQNSLAWMGKLLSPARIYREERSSLIHRNKTCCGRKTRFEIEGSIAAPKDRWPHHVVPRGILLSPIYLSASPLWYDFITIHRVTVSASCFDFSHCFIIELGHRYSALMGPTGFPIQCASTTRTCSHPNAFIRSGFLNIPLTFVIRNTCREWLQSSAFTPPLSPLLPSVPGSGLNFESMAKKSQKNKMPTEPIERLASFENVANNWHFVSSIWASTSKSPISKSFSQTMKQTKAVLHNLERLSDQLLPKKHPKVDVQKLSHGLYVSF